MNTAGTMAFAGWTWAVRVWRRLQAARGQALPRHAGHLSTGAAHAIVVRVNPNEPRSAAIGESALDRSTHSPAVNADTALRKQRVLTPQTNGSGGTGVVGSVSPIARWWRGLRSTPRAINLALQGGGAHGAFTWGVLDALLADPRMRIEGLSGSSAGAMNAVVLANGWVTHGRDGARQALLDFWTGVGKQMPVGLVTHSEGDAIRLSPTSQAWANWAAYFSPSQLNPFDHNPLRDLLDSQIDFERLRAACPFKLFIGATHASTGKLRVFREGELTLDMLLASACLPKIHHAVEIGGQPYWDGGYSANPAIFPLFYECVASDVLLVLLSPLQRDGTPRTVDEIESRIVELSFSAHFTREMCMFAHARDYAGANWWSGGRLERRLQKMRFHMIDSSQIAGLQRTDTKLLAHPSFLERLREQGELRAAAWLADHFDGVGRRSTVDVQRLFA